MGSDKVYDGEVVGWSAPYFAGGKSILHIELPDDEVTRGALTGTKVQLVIVGD